jgi:hypothetical protein
MRSLNRQDLNPDFLVERITSDIAAQRSLSLKFLKTQRMWTCGAGILEVGRIWEYRCDQVACRLGVKVYRSAGTAGDMQGCHGRPFEIESVAHAHGFLRGMSLWSWWSVPLPSELSTQSLRDPAGVRLGAVDQPIVVFHQKRVSPVFPTGVAPTS